MAALRVSPSLTDAQTSLKFGKSSQADTPAMSTSKECYLHIELENYTNFLISYQQTFHLRTRSSSASWCSKIAQQWCFFHCSNQRFIPLVHLTTIHLSLNVSFTGSDDPHYTRIISLKKLWKYSSLSGNLPSHHSAIA